MDWTYGVLSGGHPPLNQPTAGAKGFALLKGGSPYTVKRKRRRRGEEKGEPTSERVFTLFLDCPTCLTRKEPNEFRHAGWITAKSNDRTWKLGREPPIPSQPDHTTRTGLPYHAQAGRHLRGRRRVISVRALRHATSAVARFQHVIDLKRPTASMLFSPPSALDCLLPD